MVGDFDQQKLIALAKKYYGSWKRGNVHARHSAGAAPEGRKIREDSVEIKDVAHPRNRIPRAGLQRQEDRYAGDGPSLTVVLFARRRTFTGSSLSKIRLSTPLGPTIPTTGTPTSSIFLLV